VAIVSAAGAIPLAGAPAADEGGRLARVRAEAPRVMDHPSGFLSLSARNRFFSIDGEAGFIAYREQGKHLVAFGGVNAPRESWDRLLDAFIEAARARGRRVMVVQLRESQVPLFTARGFTVNPLGTSYAVSLKGYSLAGTKKMKLRNKIKRAKTEGLVVQEVGRELPRSEDTFGRLREVSAAWLAGKGKKELEFMIGELGEVADADRRIFVVTDAQGQAQAFISYVPVWGARPGLLHDLTRKRPTAGVGAQELCNSFAIERFMVEGVAYLHFGFTPFIVEPQAGANASRLMHWVVQKLRRHGQAVYPSDNQASYKTKWGTDVLEQEYVAARPLSIRAIVDLLLLTRAV
jgi:lysylphosphatidylglycerol synthetase-like protein (DUF2156 family)